jgi:hypothetical protein
MALMAADALTFYDTFVGSTASVGDCTATWRNSMSEKSTNVKALPVAAPIAGTVVDEVAIDATDQWLVLIGDSSQASDAEDVLRYLRDMWPEVERDCLSH